MSDFTYNSFPIPAKPLSGVGETSYLSALLGIAPGGVKKVPTASFLAAAGVYPVALLQCTPQITQVIGDVAANTTLIPLIADTTVSGGDTGVSTGGMSVGDSSPNTGKIVISEAGLYRVSCSIRITRTSSDGGECGAVIMKNGSSVITSVYDEADTDDHFTLTCPTVIASLASGDVLSLNAAIVGGSSESIYVNGASLLPEDVPTPTSVVLVERLNSASGDSSSTESLAELAAEVQDAREGYDGTTYPSLGASIRGQILEVMLHGGGGVTEDIKQALLNCFAHVAWDDDDPTGQSYIDALEDALYPPANLVSITAVYTQTGTVYDTDSLDDLRTDLVVTANYDDSSTEVVTTYTLSGTLTTGTSTITVTYGGKTTTFTVTVTHQVPEYVTDGLIDKWDGINNTGEGHDSSATTWKDLVGSCDISIGATVWESDGLVFPGSGVNSGSSSIWNATTMRYGTIEVVIQPDYTAESEVIIAGFDVYGSGTSSRQFAFTDDHILFQGYSGRSSYSLPSGSINDIRSLSCVYADNASVYKGYANGVELTLDATTVGSYSTRRTDSMKIRLGRKYDAAGWNYKGKILAIRAYSRQLTAAEIAQNWAADVDRFGFGA